MSVTHFVSGWQASKSRSSRFSTPTGRLPGFWPNPRFLRRGQAQAAAQEAALKFKETCGLHAEAYSSAEVKHGPMALVGPGFPVLCFAQPDETEAGTLALAPEFRGRGAQVWAASPQGDLPLADAPHPACAPLLTIQSFYRAINALALRRGHNPDVPPHLNKVTETV